MKNKKLTEEQKETADRYALKKWPDESVTVEDETNSEGEIIFRRVKITTKPADKALSSSKRKSKSAADTPKGTEI